MRELENAIEHALALCEGDSIRVDDLPVSVRQAGETESLREDWRTGRFTFEQAVARFESQLLREALERSGWNQTRAAEELGVTRRVLKLKMDRLSIDAPPRRLGGSWAPLSTMP